MSLLAQLTSSPTAKPSYWREFTLVLSAHLGEYRSKPLLNIGFIVSLAIATSTLLSIFILNDASKQQYQNAHARLKSPIAFHLVDKQKQPISVAQFSRLRALGFPQINAVHVVNKTLANGKAITFYGLDILPLVLTAPEHYQLDNINISHAYANDLGLTSGSALKLKHDKPSGDKHTEHTLEEKVHVNFVNDWGKVALIDITYLWQLFPELKGFSHLNVGTISAEQQARLTAQLPDNLTIQPVWTLDERAGFADALHLNLSALAILGFIVSLFIAYQAADQAWQNRSQLAAQLRLLGVELSGIKRVMLLEAFSLIVLASGLGLAIAIALVSALLPMLGITLEQLYQLRISGHFQWQWKYGLWALLVSAGAVFLALLKQFRVISTAQVALMARQHPTGFAYKFASLVAMGLGLAFVFIPQLDMGESGVNAWHLLMLKYGLLLMASVAILPILLKYLLLAIALGMRSFKLGFIFKDASLQVGRRFLPLAAFYLALTASISAALMVHSFESAFVSYLNQLLNSDAFISYNREEKEKVSQYLAQQNNISGYALYEHTSAQYRQQHTNEKVAIYALATKRQSQGLLFKQGGLSEQATACYINEQFAFKHQTQLKQWLFFEQGRSEFSCQVQGIYYDYGNHGLAVKVASAHAHHFLANWVETGFGIYLAPGAKFNQDKLINELGLKNDQVFIPQQIKQLALDVFKQTFVLTQAIAFVLLSIACFGLFMSANSLELARKQDLHILSSLGYSRIELLKHMLSQWFVLAGGAVLLSWPVASILANALVTKILPASFGWSMPLSLDVMPFAISSVIGLVILLPALAIPLYKLNVRANLS